MTPPPARNGEAEDVWLQQLHSLSWAVIENWLPDPDLSALRQEVIALRDGGTLKPAGIGRGRGQQLAPDIRADLIHWHDPQALTVAQAPLWRALEELRVLLNRRFYLGLKRFEGHYAVYPPGAHYEKHLDQFRDAGHRRVSFVLYLNRAWSPGLGGALRLFDAHTQHQALTDIGPHWGRAVVFFSDSVPHEVITTQAERFSFVGWFRDDDATGAR